jgi:hypothetical protein
MAVSAVVVEAWAPVVRFITLVVFSQSRTAPSRITVRLEAMAVTVPLITEEGQEEEDLPETAVPGAAEVAAVAAARAAMVANAEPSSRTPAALLPAALMGLEAAAAEQVSLERKGSRALVSRVVSVGFAAAGMVGILMEAMAAKQPVREAAVVLVAVESTTRCVSLLLHVAGMAAGGPSAVVAVAA